VKKITWFHFLAAAIVFLSLPSCASTGSGNGLSLQDAVRESSQTLAQVLPDGSRVAIVSFESENDGLSGFIMEELTSAIMGQGIEVADRANMELAFRELDFSMTGYVSDETALSIGRMLGAQFVITGQLTDLGANRRLTVNAMEVETAVRKSTASYDVRNDKELEGMIDALNRSTTKKTADYAIE
jgi:TolB-like protein